MHAILYKVCIKVSNGYYIEHKRYKKLRLAATQMTWNSHKSRHMLLFVSSATKPKITQDKGLSYKGHPHSLHLQIVNHSSSGSYRLIKTHAYKDVLALLWFHDWVSTSNNFSSSLHFDTTGSLRITRFMLDTSGSRRIHLGRCLIQQVSILSDTSGSRSKITLVLTGTEK